MQMQAYAACDDDEVREVVREEFLRLVRFVQSASGATDDEIRDWLSFGMLMNIGGRDGPVQGRRRLGAHVRGLLMGEARAKSDG